MRSAQAAEPLGLERPEPPEIWKTEGLRRLEPRLQRQIEDSVRYNLVYCFER
jgi:hypothetical protein